MSNRAIVNVATGALYVRGQQRLYQDVVALGNTPMIAWTDELPTYSPPHSEIPYAFKGWALKAANCTHHKDVLLWCDSSIVLGERPLEDLWCKIEKQGYWIAKNPGNYSNYEWTADSAYPDLFPEHSGMALSGIARTTNRLIPHVVATAFGLDLRKAVGRAILDEYLRLAQTKAFCGPWVNGAYGKLPKPLDVSNVLISTGRFGLCGPADVRGHRHDQSALSVIAWRLGCELTTCPEFFAYFGGETDKTCLVAKGV